MSLEIDREMATAMKCPVYKYSHEMWRVGSFIYRLQLCRCPDLSDFQQKISSILSHNEKLLKEKEALVLGLVHQVQKRGGLEIGRQSLLENLHVSYIWLNRNDIK